MESVLNHQQNETDRSGNMSFEYDGFWIHATDRYSIEWKTKGENLIPPIEAFHHQLIILQYLEINRNE